MQQLSQELESDDSRSYRHQVGSPILNSPPGAWAHFGSPTDSSSVRAYSQSLNFSAASSVPSNYLPGLASILTPRTMNTTKIAPIGKEQSKVNNADQVFPNHSTNGLPFQSSRSFPEHSNGMVPNMSSSSGTSFGHSTPGGSDIGTLSGNQFLWGSSNPYAEHPQSSAWPRSPMGNSFVSNGHGQGITYSSRHASFIPSSHHHVGSAPSGMPFERHFGYFPDSSEASFVNPNALGSMSSFGRNEGRLSTNMGTRGPVNSGVTLDNYSDNGSTGIRMITSQGLGNMFLGTTTFSALTGFEGLTERGRSRRVDNNGFDNSKQQYQLDLEKIISGEDTRTTLMIKNIPNKYTSKMLLAAIDEKHTGSYDFLYLPIDFKNKCNVGYAFINMVSPSHVISFYQVFNGKKWEKFNSEKVASLAYARIQGLDALIAHFQNSSLMNEDKRCRPIIFQTEGSEATDQEPSPPNGTIIRVHQQQHGSSAMTSQDLPKSGLLGNGFWSGLAITRD